MLFTAKEAAAEAEAASFNCLGKFKRVLLGIGVECVLFAFGPGPTTTLGLKFSSMWGKVDTLGEIKTGWRRAYCRRSLT